MTTRATRLRPGLAVFALTGNRVQIGLAQPVVIDELTSAQADFVASLEGSQGRVLEPGHPHGSVVRRLGRLGLLDPAGTDMRVVGDLEREPFRRPEVARVCVVGADPLGTAIGRCAAEAGVGAIVFDDVTPVATAHLAALGGCTTRGQAAAWVTNAAVPQSARAAEYPGPFTATDVAIVVAHGAPGMWLARDLTVADQPHLAVVTDEDGITIGPMVTPGAGPCLMCVGLHRADRETHWPLVALQCNDARPPYAPAPAREIATGVAVDIVLRFLATGRHDPRQWRVECGEAGLSLRTTTIEPHPSCGCTDSLALGNDLQDLKAVLFEL